MIYEWFIHILPRKQHILNCGKSVLEPAIATWQCSNHLFIQKFTLFSHSCYHFDTLFRNSLKSSSVPIILILAYFESTPNRFPPLPRIFSFSTRYETWTTHASIIKLQSFRTTILRVGEGKWSCVRLTKLWFPEWWTLNRQPHVTHVCIYRIESTCSLVYVYVFPKDMFVTFWPPKKPRKHG